MSSVLWTLSIMILTASNVLALYGPHSGVVDLNPNNFDHRVKDSDGIWIVEFFAPWCGHCQQLVPEYQKAAQSLKGIINVGAINCDQHNSLCGQYGIKGFPSIKVFGGNKNAPEDYNGDRTANGIVQAAQRTAMKVVQDRMGGKTYEGPRSSGGGGGGSQNDVIELTDSNFRQLVLHSLDIWLVEFFAPWCGHCKNLKPHWEKAATELKGKVKLGAVDATIYTNLAQEYGVQGYPTIKYFAAGPKSGPEEYDGGRTSGDIVNWAMEKFIENQSPPEILQITNNEVVVENCDKKSLCIIAFLPHILDCQSECRNGHLTMLAKLGETFKKQGWGWLWTEGTAHAPLEQVLDVGGFGYPAMTVVSAKKAKYSSLTGSFSHDGIQEFLRDLSYGKGRTNPIKGAKLPTLNSIEPWDGKDGELPQVEDIDLSDVILDPPKPNIEL